MNLKNYIENRERMRQWYDCKDCIDGLQRSGRHIGQKHYMMLLNRLKD